MKVKLEIEYDGSKFLGYQRQSQGPSVQLALEQALGVYLGSIAKAQGLSGFELPPLMPSGRTDTGVDAREQIVSFPWPVELPFEAEGLRRALNGICPTAIVVKRVSPMPDTFDARHSPHTKCYSYTFSLRRHYGGMLGERAWAIGEDLDLGGMIKAARLFAGTMDFSAFRASDCTADSTVRTLIFSELSRVDRDLLVYSVGGKGFLKQMVRNIAGTLAMVGWRKITVEEISRIFESRDRRKAGPTAPAHGLVLEWVRYDE